MKITGAGESAELCTEAGWSAVDFETDEPVSKTEIELLGSLGQLTYLGMLRQPFFRVESRYWLIKGLEGERVFRVSALNGEEAILERVRSLFEGDA